MPQIDRTISRHRTALLRQDAATLAEMAERWQAVQRSLDAEAERLARDVVQRGIPRTQPWRIAQLERYRTLIDQTRAQVELYSNATAQTLTGLQSEYVQTALFNAADYFELANMTQFNRLPVGAVNVAIGTAADGSPLRALLTDAYPDAVDGMTQELINGIAEGNSIDRIVARMMQGSERGLSRMQTIARTETLRVYREATRQQYEAAGVEQYQRIEARDRRTCPGCLALDGTLYPVTEPPFDHPRGRMTLVPALPGLTRRQTTEEWFRDLPPERQREQLLSARRYNGWRRGEFDWGDMAKVVEDETWGKSVAVRPLGELGV